MHFLINFIVHSCTVSCAMSELKIVLSKVLVKSLLLIVIWSDRQKDALPAFLPVVGLLKLAPIRWQVIN